MAEVKTITLKNAEGYDSSEEESDPMSDEILSEEEEEHIATPTPLVGGAIKKDVVYPTQDIKQDIKQETSYVQPPSPSPPQALQALQVAKDQGDKDDDNDSVSSYSTTYLLGSDPLYFVLQRFLMHDGDNIVSVLKDINKNLELIAKKS